MNKKIGNRKEGDLARVSWRKESIRALKVEMAELEYDKKRLRILKTLGRLSESTYRNEKLRIFYRLVAVQVQLDRYNTWHQNNPKRNSEGQKRSRQRAAARRLHKKMVNIKEALCHVTDVNS